MQADESETAGPRRFAWVLNLDAELELADSRYAPTAKLNVQLGAYRTRAQILFGPHDVLLEPGVRAPSGYLGRAWCPTALALAAMRRCEVEPEPHPEPGTLYAANHRSLSAELGAGPPGSEYLKDEAAVLRRLGAAGSWILKRGLSFAGRGQLRVHGACELNEPQRAWLRASLAQGGVMLEPRVHPTLELGLHGFIERAGRCMLGRVCVQLVSPQGVWQRTRLAEPEELLPGERTQLFESAERAAEALRGVGYFGPFGIDAYRYAAADQPAHPPGFCALSEINARYSMGFAVGFPRPACELFAG